MKTKLILRTTGLLILTASLFVFSSCTKTSDGNLTDEQKELQNKNLETSLVDENDFTESDEDLTAVDYKEFYDQLAPHGEWVQVQPEEIGLVPKTAATGSSGSDNFLNTNLGVKDAYRSTGANVGMVYVWKPSTSLAVARVEGETPVYVPYSNGQWVNTDGGWYFKASTPVEETVSHYGRWVNSPTAGWLWVPGRVWAPAWVDWKQNDTYVSWAPLPPSVYLVNGTMSVPIIEDNSYVIVDRKYFLEPNVYKYNTMYYDDGTRILVREMRGTEGIVIVNNTMINRGPDVNIIQSIYGRDIELVRIQQVKNFNDVKYSNEKYYIYKHGFTRYKHKENVRFTINEPKSYKKYNEWKVAKSEEKEFKKEEKEFKKEEKEFRKKNKGSNRNYNGNKQRGNNHDKKHNGSSDDNKQQDANDKQKKYNDNDKGNKQDDNNKGNKNNGNDNNKGKK